MTSIFHFCGLIPGGIYFNKKAMKLGTLDISAAYLGGDSVSKIYMGTVQVYDGENISSVSTPSDEQSQEDAS